MSAITREFTKEQLIEQAKISIERYSKAVVGFPRHLNVAMDLELARIALASLEAEPVVENVHSSVIAEQLAHVLSGMKVTSHERAVINCAVDRLNKNAEVQQTQPAPASLPDEKVIGTFNAEKNELALLDKNIAVEKFAHWHAHNSLEVIVRPCRAAMLQGAEPVSNRDELPLDYLQGHKDGLEWAAQLAEANHPQTGDWLYDDPIELAKAIRKGPDMSEANCNSPVIQDGWADMLQRWLVFGRGMQNAGSQLSRNLIAETEAMLSAAPQQEVKSALEVGMSRYGDAMQKLADGGD